MPIDPRPSNIALIGMPGVGKSTVGVLLAKNLAMGFVDTDLLIQTQCKQRLRDIIQSEGTDGFRRIEEAVILAMTPQNQLIATGGSVVYSKRAMDHLRADSIVIFLEISVLELKRRFDDLDNRGVLRAPGQTLEMLFFERDPLYRRYADLTIVCDDLRPDQVVSAIKSSLSRI